MREKAESLCHEPKRCLRVLLYLAFWLMLCSKPAAGFDTGHHQDATQEAFQAEGFDSDSDAIRIAMIENWLVDYYSARPNLGDPNAKQLFEELGYFHFDNLTSTAQVRNYWAKLAINMQRQTRTTALEIKNSASPDERRRKLLKLISLLGMALHPVQDFYSHSNWAETFPAVNGKYRSNTWFDTTLPASADIHTGITTPDNPSPTGDNAKDHGSYDGGMNHDSHDRPNWAAAYIFAYSASRQWVRATKGWVDEIDPNIWPEVKQFSISGQDKRDLLDDLGASRRISEWVSFSGKDGTWKGRGSGSKVEFIIDAVHWITGRISIFVAQIYTGHYHQPLLDGLNNPDAPAGAMLDLPHLSLQIRAVEIKTVTVSAIDNPDNTPLPDPIDDRADYFSVVTIMGQPFVDSMQFNRNELIPRWRALKLVPADSQNISIRYELLDEDGKLSGSNDFCDINPGQNRTALEFTFRVADHSLSGDVNGVHDSLCNAADSAGGSPDNDAARVRFYVTETAVLDPVQSR